MITVKLLGGLGNQMFQLAFAMALEHNRYKVQLDRTSLVEGTHREYSLGVFGELNFGQPEGPRVSEMGMPFDEKYLKPADPSVLYGYWQSEKYFWKAQAQVHRAFKFRNVLTGQAKDLQDEVEKTNSTFLHVRRCDYVGLQSFHGMPSLDYYRQALNFIQNATGKYAKVFIFSDDPAWCKENFEYRVVEGNTKYEDMQIMASCKNAIIANSSFSWWGAWLQEERGVVVAPKQWFADPTVDSRDIVPGRWVKI